MQYTVAAYSDTGLQKETNQDSLCVRRAKTRASGEFVLAVVCDGMGGLQKGELASAWCVDAFADWFDRSMGALPDLCQKGFTGVREQWGRLLEEIHGDLLRYSEEHGIQLGTTVNAFLTYEDRFLTVNVGDSRTYERKNTLRQLTQDQSLVAREIAAGRLTEEESRHHPQRNILLQCLGVGEGVIPEYRDGKVQNDALYLLCSDGFVHELSIAEMGDLLQPTFLQSKEALTDALRQITEICKERGETDNITAILIKAEESRSGEVKKAGGLRTFFRRAEARESAQLEPAITMLEQALLTHTQETIGR